MKKKLTLMTLVLLWVSQMMAVDYTINVQSAGCDAVAYTLPSGAVGQIQATANTGYHFTQWSDGNTDNPRTITVTGNKTYTAQYKKSEIYTVGVQANGCDLYEHQVEEGKQLVIKAEAGAGYHFVQWNDGSTQNPRTIAVTGDKTYTASFVAVYTITAKSNNTSYGTVSGSGTYNVNTTVTLTATPKSGYKFVQWNDGNTQNPRTVTVTGDKTYTATFAAITYTITAKSNNTSYGTVSGGGEYNVNTTVTLTATPKSGYKFVQWNDGNTENPRTVTVTGNKTFTATFDAAYTITANSANTTMGTVSGGGTYAKGSIAILTATPKSGYVFVQWNDGNTENPRYVKVTGDATYTAEFAVGASQEESHGATVNNDGVSVTPYETKADFVWPSITGVASYSLVIWTMGSQQPKIQYSFIFDARGQLTYYNFMQSVKPQGSAVEEGLNYIVRGLSPGITYAYIWNAMDARDQVIDTKSGAFTTMGASGIADITAAGINIYTEGRTIIVENATEPITVSDALGRVVGMDDAHIVRTETRKFSVPSSGVYVVKIGNRSASVLVR